MSLGKLSRVQNIDRRFGSSTDYWFIKVQSDFGLEEYWLVTDTERVKFTTRSSTNIEDTAQTLRRGVLSVVENSQRRFGSDISYFGVAVQERLNEIWMLTTNELERIRRRAETNREDIEANREGWLADLLD